MGTDPGSDIKNDSNGATAVNTGIPWTQGGKPLDGKITAHVDGLTAYAKNQGTMSTNMMGEATKAQVLSQLPVDATGKGNFGEGVYVRELLVRNASEFTSYLSQLMQTFQNTGSAAQTVADCLGTTDNMSAISMDQVMFALADPNAKRPAGLNPGIGKTYGQSLAEQQKQQQGADAPVDLTKSNTVVSTGTVSGGEYIGSKQTVTTTTAPNGDKTVTTTIETAPGVSVTYTTVTVNGISNTTSSTTTVTKGQGQTTTTTKDEDGSETIDITNDDGSEVTSTFDKDGHETSVHGHAPEAEEPGLPKPEDDPYTKASKTAADQPYLSPW